MLGKTRSLLLKKIHDFELSNLVDDGKPKFSLSFCNSMLGYDG